MSAVSLSPGGALVRPCCPECGCRRLKRTKRERTHLRPCMFCRYLRTGVRVDEHQLDRKPIFRWIRMREKIYRAAGPGFGARGRLRADRQADLRWLVRAGRGPRRSESNAG